MEQQHRPAVALVEMREAHAVELAELRLPRVVGQALEPLGRRANGVGHDRDAEVTGA